MNFFKSSFISDLLAPPDLDPPPAPSPDPHAAPPPSDPSPSWGLGGLVKSLTLKSEEMLQAYRKDLQEFGSGLREESKIIAEVAAHAVKDLPASLETGASVAQESLESVGQVIEEFGSSVWRGTSEILAQGKEAVLRVDNDDDSVAAPTPVVPRYDSASITGGKYSRFEAQVKAMQHDSSTYCDEPEDGEDYSAWQGTFNLQEKKQDIDALLENNTFFQELFARFVPAVVSEDTFWTRYFYRFHKLQQTEEARAHLVKRATASEEEDLSWDTEDEVDDEGAVSDERPIENKPIDLSKDDVQNLQIAQGNPEHPETVTGEAAPDEKSENSAQRSTDAPDKHGKAVVEATLDDEDDLGWEVAEDSEESGSIDGKKSTNSEAGWEVPEVPREEMKRRINAHEEEDLSWDVDDGEDDTKP